MGRPNVTLLPHAHVTGIELEGDRAVGVRALRGGAALRVGARREVILAAGAIGSPQLMMLSGLGEEVALRRLGIPVRLANANVGRHMQDHLGANHYHECAVPTLNQQLRPWWGKLAVGARYVLGRGGPLALGVNHAGGFAASGLDGDHPDIQLYFQPFSTIQDRPGERPILTPDPFPAVGLGFSSCRPLSRGAIELASADPLAPPRIHPNSLSAPGDLQLIREALRLMRALAGTRAFGRLSVREILPGSQARDDDALMADFRQRGGTVFHPCGTCRMGPSPERAVVDAHTRVHGIRGLRVVDASVFPNLVSGNTNGPVMMTALRAGRFILQDNGEA
jgi:choline dehydrogenase